MMKRCTSERILPVCIQPQIPCVLWGDFQKVLYGAVEIQVLIESRSKTFLEAPLDVLKIMPGRGIIQFKTLRKPAVLVLNKKDS